MSSWLLTNQTEIISLAAAAAGLAFLFVLFAERAKESRSRRMSLEIAGRLMQRQKQQLDAFVADDRVPDLVKLRLVKIVSVLMDEDSCIDIIRKAHSSKPSSSYPEDVAHLRDIDPALADKFEDIISEALFAMSHYSLKVRRCVCEMIEDMMVSTGRRRLINAARDIYVSSDNKKLDPSLNYAT
jgi:hypothetical protein